MIEHYIRTFERYNRREFDNIYLFNAKKVMDEFSLDEFAFRFALEWLRKNTFAPLN